MPALPRSRGSVPVLVIRSESDSALQAPLISADMLSVARGDRTLLRGLSFVLAPGEVLHLRGRNGAGKTSLLEILAGLRQPLEGRLRKPDADALHWLGHKNALNPALTVLENLRWWCGLNAAPVSAILPALERVGMETLRHRPCRTLSAGQKRRAALARLLLAPRPLWLLDEPLSGLDVDGIERFAELLATHARSGGAAIVTSHQPLAAGLPGLRLLELA